MPFHDGGPVTSVEAVRMAAGIRPLAGGSPSWPGGASVVTAARQGEPPAWLHARDLARAHGLTAARRTEWLQGRGVLQSAVSAWAREHGDRDVMPSDVRIGIGALGEPRLEAPHDPAMSLSLAHGGDLVVGAAVGAEYRIGVDVERADRNVGSLSRMMLPSEQAMVAAGIPLLDLLVAKEAAAKAWQIGLGGSLQRWPVEYRSEEHLWVSGPDRVALPVKVDRMDGHVIGLCLARRTLG